MRIFLSMLEARLPQYQITDAERGIPGELPVSNILRDDIKKALELNGARRQLLDSVRESLWARINGGRMLLEARTLSFLQQPTPGSVNIFDFDDCLMSATRWHAREYQLLEENETLREQGVNISARTAKEIYELSKIRIPGVAEKEPRYTPRLNLILLSAYAEALREARVKGTPEEEARDKLLQLHEMLSSQTELHGERALNRFPVNSTIQAIFEGNDPADFIYGDFVQDFMFLTGKSDIRIIATRGKIEGPLGQIDKVHSSGIMRQRSVTGGVVDLVVYSNDVKSEALITIMKLLPGISERQIRVYDDNPVEIVPYLDVARSLGAPNIEVIQVSHPDAKRKDFSPGEDPFHVYKRGYKGGDTTLKHYSWKHTATPA